VRLLCLTLLLPLPLAAQPDPATLVRGSMSADVVALSLLVESARDEVAILSTVGAIEGINDATAREMLRLDAATRLADQGTTMSLVQLRAWSAIEPTVTTMVDGCRTQHEVPLFDYKTASLLASERITVEHDAATLRARLGRDPDGWLDALTPVSEPLGAALPLAYRQLDQPLARAILARLHDPPSTPQGSLAVAELILVADAAPDPLIVDAFPDLLCVRLYEERARLGSAVWSAMEPRISTAPGVASQWRIAQASAAPLSIRLSSGAEGAAAASDAAVAELETSAADPALAQSAVLALMLQDSQESRAALRRIIAQGTLDATLQRKLRTWLAK
jgi:hypothetical protein